MDIPDTNPSALTRARRSGAVHPGWTLCAFALFALQVLAVVGMDAHATTASLTLLVASPMLAMAACIDRARHESRATPWWVLALAMLLWGAAMALNALDALALQERDSESSIILLLFVLYSVPIIFVTASPLRDPWLVRLVDVVLAVTVAALFFAHTLAFSGPSGYDDDGAVRLRMMFDIQNLTIAAMAALLWKADADPSARRFSAALTLFAVLYLLCAGYINHLATDTGYGGPTDLLIGLPFLALAIAATRTPQRAPAGNANPSRTFSRVVRIGRPLLLPVMLLISAVTLLDSYPVLAVAGIVVGTLGYGVRNVLTQLHGLRERDRLGHLSAKDALTGLPNRRSFDQSLRREWTRAVQEGRQFGLLMIDIDHFKLLNDTAGHPEGDRRLRQVARILQQSMRRGNDMVARYGGEEFAVILPGSGASDAQALAERMRSAVQQAALGSPAPAGMVTVSIGIGHCEARLELTPQALLEAADAALYEAKRAGRNRIALGPATTPG